MLLKFRGISLNSSKLQMTPDGFKFTPSPELSIAIESIGYLHCIKGVLMAQLKALIILSYWKTLIDPRI